MPNARPLYIILQVSFCLLAGSDSVGHKESDVLPFLSSKAPYPVREIIPNGNFSRDCQPIYINHLARHGSRYQTKNKDIEKLSEIIARAEQQDGLQELGQKLPLLLKETQRIQPPELLGQLSEQGRNEHRGIAQRMYENFLPLFTNNNINKPIVLQSTRKQRTTDSRNAFLEKLVELQPTLAERAQIITGQNYCDPLLRFMDGCNALNKYQDEHPWKPAVRQAIWSQNNINNIKSLLERIFKPEFLKEFDDDSQIDIARNLYHMCQLDANIGKAHDKNGYCSFFADSNEMEPFNWEDDAKNYFNRGFAGQDGAISHQVACVLLNDFITTTNAAINSPQSAPVANLRFAHAETTTPFLVLLGLYREDTIEALLTNSNDRIFRMANISPMAANIQWILYQCPQNEFRVRMLHNERDIAFPIPGCDDTGCSWETIKAYYQSQGRTCDQNTWINNICQGVSCAMN